MSHNQQTMLADLRAYKLIDTTKVWHSTMFVFFFGHWLVLEIEPIANPLKKMAKISELVANELTRREINLISSSNQ
jgi:hypothetical protein